MPGTSSLGDYVCGPNQAFGLAESKMIVENFDKFLAFVEEHNEMPEFGYSWGEQPFTKKRA